MLLSTALTNQEGDQFNEKSNKTTSEAAMVRNFANQFNINIKMDNIDKHSSKRSNES